MTKYPGPVYGIIFIIYEKSIFFNRESDMSGVEEFPTVMLSASDTISTKRLESS